MDYLQHVVDMQAPGPGLSFQSTSLERDLPLSFVEALLSKPNIYQTVSFFVDCRGFRHLRCDRRVLVTRENLRQFGRCDKCQALQEADQHCVIATSKRPRPSDATQTEPLQKDPVHSQSPTSI